MSSDPKQGERDYYAHLGPDGIAHSLGKPFSDNDCALYLTAMAALFGVMEPPPRRIVEFGCGTGWLSLTFAQRGYDVLGIDIAEDAVGHARAAAEARGLGRVEFIACDYESFDGHAIYDYAVFHAALHHAESELAALRCAHAALKPGGCVIAIEPGSGHSASEGARHAIAKYGVHEKDMPPAHIVRVGHAAGFRRHLVLPYPGQLSRLLYRRAYHRASSQAELFSLRFLSTARSLLNLLRWRTDPGLVLLWK